MTDWPLVADADVLQLGERESRDTDFAWPDVNDTAFNRIDIFEALAIGPAAVTACITDALRHTPSQGFWVHLDVDVLDQAVMPAVDCPGTPGLDPADLVQILTPLVSAPRCRGMTVTVFDPNLDPDGRFAETVVAIMAQLPFP